jgi:hypothetical protein
MNKRTVIAAFAVASTLAAGAARAVQVAGGGAPGADSRPAAVEPAVRAAMRDDSDSLLAGVIDAIDVTNGTVVIQGHLLNFDPSSAQVFSAGGSALSPSALRVHQSVRFLLDRKDPGRRTIRVFYAP